MNLICTKIYAATCNVLYTKDTSDYLRILRQRMHFGDFRQRVISLEDRQCLTEEFEGMILYQGAGKIKF